MLVCDSLLARGWEARQQRGGDGNGNDGVMMAVSAGVGCGCGGSVLQFVAA